MAILKIVTKEYRNADALDKLIFYALNKTKMPSNIWGGIGISYKAPAESMNIIKKAYGKTTGRQASHFILAFDKREERTLCTSFLNQIAYEICGFFQNIQVFYAVHETKNTYLSDDFGDGFKHIHFIVNTVEVQSGKKFRLDFGNSYDLRGYVEEVLSRHGVSDFVRLVTKSTDGWPI